MNTALKSNIYPIKPLDNQITKSRSKKEILLGKLSAAIRLKHYSNATDRIFAPFMADYLSIKTGG
jgi:hypothetical protein